MVMRSRRGVMMSPRATASTCGGGCGGDCRDTPVPRPCENNHPPRTTLGLYAEAYGRVLGGGLLFLRYPCNLPFPSAPEGGGVEAA